MKKIPFKFLTLLTLVSLSALPRASAQSTVGLNIDSGSFTLNNANNVTPLATGDVLQFGYYSAATTNNPFAGTWIALTGNGGTNSGLNFTEIGGNPVNGAGDGTFAYTTTDLTFSTGSSTTGVGLPSAGQMMAVRFYNGTTVASSSAFGSASDASWNWVAPAQIAPIPMSFSLDDSGVTFSNGAVAFTGTSITAAPEPSVGLLAAASLIILFFTHKIWRRAA